MAQEKCRREIEQSKRSPRHAQPLPAAAAASTSPMAEHADEATGDHKPKYKRPGKTC